MLKDLGIEIESNYCVPLGETGYFLYHDEETFSCLINKKRKCIESIIISKESYTAVVDYNTPNVFYLVNEEKDRRIEFDLFSEKMEPGALPHHLILINNFIPIPAKFCTTYDIDEGSVTIYENFKAFRASKVLAKIQLKMCNAPFIDILHK
jgi:hypothetical protein